MVQQVLRSCHPNQQKSGLAVGALVPGVVGDRVWADSNGNGVQDAGEAGVNGVRVELYQDNGDGTPDCSTDTQVAFTVTTGDGNYLFSHVPSGNYFLLIEKPTTSNFSPTGAGDSATDSDFLAALCDGWAVGITPMIAVTDTDFLYEYNAALVPSGLSAVGDYVWLDANDNGLQDEGAGAGLNSVIVELLATDGSVVATQRTKSGLDGRAGKYQFDNVLPNSYRLRLQAGPPANYGPSLVGADRQADSDFDPATGMTASFTLAAKQTNISLDAALATSPVEICGNGLDDDGDGKIDCPQISGYVYEDINYGGGAGRSFTEANTSATSSGWTNGAIGSDNVLVELYQTAGTLQSSTRTDATGAYTFPNLEAGSYYVRVVTNSIRSNIDLNVTGATLLEFDSFQAQLDQTFECLVIILVLM